MAHKFCTADKSSCFCTRDQIPSQHGKHHCSTCTYHRRTNCDTPGAHTGYVTEHTRGVRPPGPCVASVSTPGGTHAVTHLFPLPDLVQTECTISHAPGSGRVHSRHTQPFMRAPAEGTASRAAVFTGGAARRIQRERGPACIIALLMRPQHARETPLPENIFNQGWT